MEQNKGIEFLDSDDDTESSSSGTTLQDTEGTHPRDKDIPSKPARRPPPSKAKEEISGPAKIPETKKQMSPKLPSPANRPPPPGPRKMSMKRPPPPRAGNKEPEEAEKPGSQGNKENDSSGGGPLSVKW